MDYWNGFWPIYSLKLYLKDKFGSKNNKKQKEKNGQKEDLPP